jgi:hypothetical protein
MRVDATVEPGRAAQLLIRDLATLRGAPDVNAIPTVAIPGSPFAASLSGELRRLRHGGLHAEVRAPVTRLSVAPPAYPDDHRVFVDTGAGERVERRADGTVAARTPLAPAHWLYVLACWPDGHWVLADAFEIHPEWVR